MKNNSHSLNQVLKSFSVCTSNLDEKQRQLAEELIKEMGGTYHINMMKSTKILISNKINTDKCLVASQQNIPIISLDWIKLCHKKKKLLDNKDFKLKTFHGIKISLFGFETNEEHSLKKLIENNQGIILKNIQDTDVIVIKSGLFMLNSDQTLMEQNDYKIVIEKWIYDCIEKQNFIKLNTSIYKYKNDVLKQKFEKIEKEYLSNNTMHALSFPISKINGNSCHSFRKSSRRNLNRIHDNNENEDDEIDILATVPVNINLLFSKFIFHISPEFQKDTKDVLIKAISLGGGLHFKEVSPLTSHIICNSNKDNFSNRSLSFGIYFRPEFINPNWVIESLKEKTLLSLIDYRPISSLVTLLNVSNAQAKSEIYLTTSVISYIFKGQKFYIYTESYTDEENNKIKENILQNGGDVVEPNSEVKAKSNLGINADYIIINDGYSPSDMSKLIERKIKEFSFIMSHRFVDMCITKRSLINLSKYKFIHVIPFQYPVPFQDFIEKQITVHFYGFSGLEINVMEQFLETLGGICETSKKTTHIVCKESISMDHANKYKSKYGDGIIYVAIDWMLECLMEGHLVKEDKFLINPIEDKKENKKERKNSISKLEKTQDSK